MIEKTVLFDIDGTLADLTHRLHHIQIGRDWEAFHAEVGNDTVIEPIRELAQALFRQAYKIVLVTGRPDTVRGLTEAWLDANDVPHHELHMRREDDYRQDFIVKSGILDNLLAEGHDILCVVDDRPSVVAMWRERGLVCLQCRTWDEASPRPRGLLTLMVGPSGGGKTHWLKGHDAVKLGIHSSHVVSSEQFRADLFGEFRDQSLNEEVFAALHAVVKARVLNGLPTVVDATNLKRKDRLAVVALSDGGPVRYIVIDRPMTEKARDTGWRAGLHFDLMTKHQNTFNSQLDAILAGDSQPNVKVIDLRRHE